VFHVKHDDALEVAAEIGLELGPGHVELLVRFARLLDERAIPLGLVAASDRSVLWSRHVLDSLRVAPLVEGAVADLGSGAGLPGIVLAITRPDVSVSLVEPRRRRLSFLELAVDLLELANARPVGVRAEQVSGSFDSVVARALADPDRSWRLADRLLRPGGRLVYFAGAGFQPELVTAAGVRVETVQPPRLLARSGPLVIMSRR
jgi:16S rRNA (guanine527-N7)-methyltransferase